MAEPGWPRHALRIGLFEFRRTVRALWQDKARFAMQSLSSLVPSLIGTFFIVLLADAIRTIDPIPVPEQLLGMVALFWLFLVVMVGQRTVSARTQIEAHPLMLTTVSARTVAGGLLFAETLRILANLGPVVLVATGAGVFLFGSLASLVVVPTAAVLFAASAAVTGAVAGYAVVWLLATSAFVARHKTVLGIAAGLIVGGSYPLLFIPNISPVGPEIFAWLPVGWLADLAVIGTPFIGSSLRALGALVGCVVLVLGGCVVIERETTALWFTERAIETTDDETGDTAIRGRDALEAAVKPLVIPSVVNQPTRRVAQWVLLRTRRDPNRLTFILIPVMAIGGSFVGTGFESGSLTALLGPLSAVVLPWLAGALFALNPLGDEGTLLPVTITAVSGKQYVRGLMVPGLVIGLPVVALVTTITAAISPYTAIQQAALVGLGVYLTVVSVTITPAIGMALPRFSAVSIGQSDDVLPPRFSAVGVHMALIILPGSLLATLVLAPNVAQSVLAGLLGLLPAFILELLAGSNAGLLATVAEWFTRVGAEIQAVNLSLLRIDAGGTLLIGGVAVAFVLYRNAVHRFQRYSPTL